MNKLSVHGTKEHVRQLLILVVFTIERGCLGVWGQERVSLSDQPRPLLWESYVSRKDWPGRSNHSSNIDRQCEENLRRAQYAMGLRHPLAARHTTPTIQQSVVTTHLISLPPTTKLPVDDTDHFCMLPPHDLPALAHNNTSSPFIACSTVDEG